MHWLLEFAERFWSCQRHCQSHSSNNWHCCKGNMESSSLRIHSIHSSPVIFLLPDSVANKSPLIKGVRGKFFSRVKVQVLCTQLISFLLLNMNSNNTSPLHQSAHSSFMVSSGNLLQTLCSLH